MVPFRTIFVTFLCPTPNIFIFCPYFIMEENHPLAAGVFVHIFDNCAILAKLHDFNFEFFNQQIIEPTNVNGCYSLL